MGHRFPQKNKRTNSTILLWYVPQVELFSFVVWRKSTTPKNHFEINWPLEPRVETGFWLKSLFHLFDLTIFLTALISRIFLFLSVFYSPRSHELSLPSFKQGEGCVIEFHIVAFCKPKQTGSWAVNNYILSTIFNI